MLTLEEERQLDSLAHWIKQSYFRSGRSEALNDLSERLLFHFFRLYPEHVQFIKGNELTPRFALEIAKAGETNNYLLSNLLTEEMEFALSFKESEAITIDTLSNELKLINYSTPSKVQAHLKRKPNFKLLDQMEKAFYSIPYEHRWDTEYLIEGSETGDKEVEIQSLKLWNQHYDCAETTEERLALASLIQEHPNVLFLLNNKDKNYRLCRLANRLLDETKFASPYRVLELLDQRLL